MKTVVAAAIKIGIRIAYKCKYMSWNARAATDDMETENWIEVNLWLQMSWHINIYYGKVIFCFVPFRETCI